MKKLLVGLLAAGMLFGGATAASAAKPEDAGPGPNGNNEHGLCTAYFNGQKKGHDKNGSPGPFAALEEDATAYDETNGGNEETADRNETDVSDDVFEFCTGVTTIGGNPEHNGRYDCREGEEPDSPIRDSDGDFEYECVANGTETPPAA